MTIQSQINELNSIKNEIKRNNERNKKLRSRLKELENNITDYLESKSQVGLKYKNQAMTIQHTTSYSRKKKVEKEEEMKKYLKSIGIQDTSKVYKDISKINKGKESSVTKLKIKDIKN